MRQAMKKVVLGALIGAALVSLAGCGGGSAPKTSGVPKDTLVVGLPKDTLVVGLPKDPETLDPAVTMDNTSWSITYPAYERLVRYRTVDGKASTEVEPGSQSRGMSPAMGSHGPSIWRTGINLQMVRLSMRRR